MIGPDISAPRSRLRWLSLAVLIAAGLASIATSPAMRRSSTSYEEVLRLTDAAPAVTRHFSVDITNRDPKLDELVMIAGAYSTDPDNGSRSDSPGVVVSLLPDVGAGTIDKSSRYSGTNVSFLEACRISCQTSVTVVVRLKEPAAAGTPEVATNLVVNLFAEASDEGSGPVDIDLGLVNDVDRAFQGAPTTLVTRQEGSVHVGADAPSFDTSFEIVIDAGALQLPYGFPLVAEITVGAERAIAVGHPFAHSTEFAFESPTLPEGADTYASVGISGGWEGEPPAPPKVLDLLPLCAPAVECRISVSLTSRYDAQYNEPEESGARPIVGSIDIDWFLEIRLEAYDGRSLPEGSVRFEGVD